MTRESDIKTQRDRFLAFAFAAADLLIEVSKDGRMVFASGASRAITGHDEKALIGKDFLSLFLNEDKSLISALTTNTQSNAKQGPYLLKISNSNNPIDQKHVFVSSFSLNGAGPVRVALTLADALLSFIEFSREETTIAQIASSEHFENILRQKMASLEKGNAPVDVQLFELNGIGGAKKSLDANSWAGLTAAIGQLMMESSLDGETAVKVDDEKYLLLTEHANEVEKNLYERIRQVAEQYNIGDTLDIKSKNIEGDLTTLSPREATRAVLYTMNKMEQSGLDSVGDNLKGAFTAFLEENATKISNLKRMISHQDFTLNFQPIVEISSGDLSHHEVLIRFEEGKSPFEMITMCEDIGLSPDLDLGVCRQSLKFVDQSLRKKKKIGKLAVNLSGQSIQNAKFVEKLLSTLNEYPEAAAHLMFEITESSEIKDLDKVNTYIQKLRKAGYTVCLDDFGAGSASFQYLHKLTVDGVKIDGGYVRNLLSSSRDAAMVRNMTQMCHELGVYVVAEMVENIDQKNFLMQIGVEKGQGWLFGKPKETPEQPDI